MKYHEKCWIDSWKANPASFRTFHTWPAHERVLKKYGITRDCNKVVSRITKNKTRIHNTHGTVSATFGDISPDFLQEIIGIGTPWSYVGMKKSEYPKDTDFRERFLRGEIVIDLDVERRPYPCPNCGVLCKPHQYETRHYNHLPFMGYATVIKAKVPKLRCEVCQGYPQVPVPWARPNTSYTVLTEVAVFQHICCMSVNKAARFVGLEVWSIWGMIEYRVNQALDRMDLSTVTMIFIDETSFLKGLSFITVVCDQDHRVIYIREGKDSTTVDDLSGWLLDHGGDPLNIRVVSCDLGDAYPAGVRRNFPNACIVYDRFHAVKLFQEGMDKVLNRDLAKNAELTRIRGLARRNPSNLSEEQIRKINHVLDDFKDSAEAYRLKNVLSSIYNYTDKETAGKVLDMWYQSVLASGLDELQTPAKSIMERRDGILAFFDDRVTNGFAEGMNSLIQTTKAVARGYSNFEHFKLMIFLRNGGLKITFENEPDVIECTADGACPESCTRGVAERAGPRRARRGTSRGRHLPRFR